MRCFICEEKFNEMTKHRYCRRFQNFDSFGISSPIFIIARFFDRNYRQTYTKKTKKKVNFSLLLFKANESNYSVIKRNTTTDEKDLTQSETPAQNQPASKPLIHKIRFPQHGAA